MTKKTSDKDTVRKIWLAGIGAYGRALTEAKGAVDSLAGKGSEVFDELVQKGEMLETVGRVKANELAGKGKAAVEDITPDFNIDDRIAKMRSRLSGAMEKGDDRLAARVDRLEAKLDAILDALDIGEAAPTRKKPAAKKTPTKKKAPTRKTKTASKKKMTTQRTPKVKAASKPKAKTTKKTTAKAKMSAKAKTSKATKK
jgi:polyhydroxyalkanoate synthesis regulator phasin